MHYIISLLKTHFTNYFYYFLQCLSYYTTILVASIREKEEEQAFVLHSLRLNGKLF